MNTLKSINGSLEPQTDYQQYWEERVRTDNIKKKPRHYEIVNLITSSREKGKILDLGCGEGHILNSIPEPFEVYGADISSTPLKFLNDRINSKQCDLSNSFPFEMTFDIIVCSEVIEHVSKPDYLLKNIYEHMEDDGIAILSIPNHKNTKERGGDPTHIHGWRVKEFKIFLSEYGLRVIKHYPTLFSIGQFNLTKAKRLLLMATLKRLPVNLLMDLMGEQIIFVCKRIN